MKHFPSVSRKEKVNLEGQMRDALGDVANEVLDMAERLVLVGEKLNQVVREPDAEWMAGAKAELDELIRSVEANRLRALMDGDAE
jgi:hypothetical protein